MKIIEAFIHVNKWIKLSSGILLCLIIFLLIDYFKLENSSIVKQEIIPLAVPGAYALIGLLEIITGTPFLEISKKWDSLAGWQRGILGIIVVILFFLLFMFGVIAFA